MFAAAFCYAVCAFLPARRPAVLAAATAAAWILHGAGLWPDMLAHDTIRLGFAVMLSAAMWISVAVYWIENRNLALDGLRALVLPSAAIAAILPAIFPGSVFSLEGKSPLFSWHIAIAILAYSTLTIAAFHAVLMALQESRLHTRGDAARGGWFAAAVDRLPPLLTMEKLLFRMIGLGFFLLTLTMMSGIVFSEELFGTPWQWTHKTVFTILSWLLFGALLAGRRWRGWRGKTALRLILTGFATLLLAYVGTRFVFEVILHRSFA